MSEQGQNGTLGVVTALYHKAILLMAESFKDNKARDSFRIPDPIGQNLGSILYKEYYFDETFWLDGQKIDDDMDMDALLSDSYNIKVVFLAFFGIFVFVVAVFILSYFTRF